MGEDNIDTKVAVLEVRVKNLEDRNEEFKQYFRTVDKLTTKFDALEDKIDVLIEAQKEKVELLKNEGKQTNKLVDALPVVLKWLPVAIVILLYILAASQGITLPKITP